MSVEDIFSKRQKRLQGEVPDVYQYDEIPYELRVQVVHILRDTLGPPYYDSFGKLYYLDQTEEAYEFIHKVLCREYGIFRLQEQADSDVDAVENFFLSTGEAENVIDVIELAFQILDPNVRRLSSLNIESDIPTDEAITELNQRFRDHGVGYQYESGKMIRVDSRFIHSEVMQPALTILSDSMYEGANAEYLNAHAHYRAKRYKECLNDCLKAFESCLKAICDKRGWAYDARDTANRLIAIVFENRLIPDFMQSHFTALRKTLEAGVPTLRNKRGGHGQGTRVVAVPEHIATYALHLTASNILFLAQANENLT